MATIPVNQKKLTYWCEMLERPDLFLLPMTPREVAAEIRGVIKDLSRRKAVRKAPAKSVPITREVSRRLRLLAIAYPDKTEQDIAQFAGVTAGRVSEAIAGKRR
jgi:hypothetical protein